MCPSDDLNGSHPDGELIAAYVERVLPEEEREALEGHLSECAACRSEVAEVTLFLRRETLRRRRRLALPLAAAAAAALLLVAIWPTTVGESGRLALRQGPESSAEALPSIMATSPEPGAVVHVDSAVFTWRSLAADAFYRLTVATEEGEVVLREETPDTVLSLPPEVMLSPGRGYFWFVDALLPDGREATTGVRRFYTAP